MKLKTKLMSMYAPTLCLTLVKLKSYFNPLLTFDCGLVV